MNVSGIKYLRLPHLTLLNLEGTRVRECVQETLQTTCPNLQRVILANIVPLRDSEEEDI